MNIIHNSIVSHIAYFLHFKVRLVSIKIAVNLQRHGFAMRYQLFTKQLLKSTMRKCNTLILSIRPILLMQFFTQNV